MRRDGRRWAHEFFRRLEGAPHALERTEPLQLVWQIPSISSVEGERYL